LQRRVGRDRARESLLKASSLLLFSLNICARDVKISLRAFQFEVNGTDVGLGLDTALLFLVQPLSDRRQLLRELTDATVALHHPLESQSLIFL
jgi:hypothetical protein